MAAPGSVGSRSAQHEERAGSLESVPTACPASLERPAEPGKAAEQPGRTLWERICEEYEVELPPFPEGYRIQREAVLPVSPMEESLFRGFSAEHSYPFPHWATDSHIPCTQIKLETIDPKTCSPKEYLETFIFPVLLPGIASLLHQAKKEKCFEDQAWDTEGTKYSPALKKTSLVVKDNGEQRTPKPHHVEWLPGPAYAVRTAILWRSSCDGHLMAAIL
ncbi:hypothetical protein QTO34_013098 [Cnephaeus nilssonii]|uniref:IQ motif containing K n=1 Tax=Cnephaeus nilssonii TaxID=3371016 RepID=A0AA40I7G1_CNENI|nr:hypothetical protein QTO34_013098 [Eptesicus nilssonii]